MNYYEHHIGDYAEATAHLSFVEDAAYSRLIRKYYAIEKALPSDVKAVQRLIGARAKEEREAVAVVLEEFFNLEEDGWHNRRCDKEIGIYLAKKPAAEGKKENDKERQKRARELRKALFDSLRSHGVTAPWDATTEQLRDALSRATNEPRHAPVTASVTHPVARDNTATQTPVPSPQTPVPIIQTSHALGIPPPDERDSENLNPGTQAGEVCKALRAAGMASVSPSHPELLALLEKGVTPAMFADAATKSVAKGKGFGYMLGIVKGQMQEAATIAAGPTAGVVVYDLDSRAAIEAEGIAKGIGKWDEVSEQWGAYKARVRGQGPAPLSIEQLSNMAARRKGGAVNRPMSPGRFTPVPNSGSTSVRPVSN